MFLICEAGSTSAWCWSVLSLLICTGNSLMVDLCLLEQKGAASFRGELDLVRSDSAVGMCWCLGSPMGATLNFVSLVLWFQSVIMK